ncbi:hypothetical protein QYF36_002955 [Acer negundo]|nr:hypothetical protein QYF36_002955 [Acer negundo]
MASVFRFSAQPEINKSEKPPDFGFNANMEFCKEGTTDKSEESNASEKQNLVSNPRNNVSEEDNLVSLLGLFHVIEEGICDGLNRAVCEEEVKVALFGIGRLKSPGPDGILAAFSQSQ